MSSIHNENIKKLLTSGEGIDFSVNFKIGDTVDSETVSLLIDRALHESSALLQKRNVFTFVDNDLGERLPCYITFSKERGSWVFRGACFEGSIINRCGGFQIASQTIGDYCVEKFYNAYIKALNSLSPEKNDSPGADIYDYIEQDALITAGYLISVYRDLVTEVFEEKGAELCKEELFDSVSELLKHKDDIYEGESLNLLKNK